MARNMIAFLVVLSLMAMQFKVDAAENNISPNPIELIGQAYMLYNSGKQCLALIPENAGKVKRAVSQGVKYQEGKCFINCIYEQFPMVDMATQLIKRNVMEKAEKNPLAQLVQKQFATCANNRVKSKDMCLNLVENTLCALRCVLKGDC